MIRIAIALFTFLVSSSVAFAGLLHEATRDGDLEQVRALIAAGADLDAQGDNGVIRGISANSPLQIGSVSHRLHLEAA